MLTLEENDKLAEIVSVVAENWSHDDLNSIYENLCSASISDDDSAAGILIVLTLARTCDSMPTGDLESIIKRSMRKLSTCGSRLRELADDILTSI